MSPEYWSQLLDKTSVMIDGSVVDEDFLGELQPTVQHVHHECELHLKLDRDGYLFFPGLFSQKEVEYLVAAVPELYERKEEYNVREKGSNAVRTNFAAHTYIANLSQN